MTHVEIRLSPDPSEERVILNGEDVSSSVAGVSIDAQAGGRNSVTIRLAAASHIDVKGVTRVRLDSSTVILLRRAGWTPPEGSHGGMAPIVLQPAESTDPASGQE